MLNTCCNVARLLHSMNDAMYTTKYQLNTTVYGQAPCMYGMVPCRALRTPGLLAVSLFADVLAHVNRLP